MPLPHNIPFELLKERNTCYMKYDYLGSRLRSVPSAIFAHMEAKVHGKSVLVVDKRTNIAGNIYTENIEGINVHKYGAHIFHTQQQKRSGTISPGLPSSTALQTLPLPTIRVSCIRCPSTCIPLIKCGASSHPEEAAAKIEEAAPVRSPTSRRTLRNRPLPCGPRHL